MDSPNPLEKEGYSYKNYIIKLTLMGAGPSKDTVFAKGGNARHKATSP